MLVTKLLSNIIDQLKELNPNFSEIKFTKRVDNNIVGLNNIYAGIVDNKQDYAYLRITSPISFSLASDKAINLDVCETHMSNINVIINLKLVTCIWNINDPFVVMQRLIESLYRINVPNKDAIKLSIQPSTFHHIKEDVITQEVKEFKMRDDMEVSALDFTVTFLWNQDKCCPTSLCRDYNCTI